MTTVDRLVDDPVWRMRFGELVLRASGGRRPDVCAPVVWAAVVALRDDPELREVILFRGQCECDAG